ncbi:MAG: hypothetical protein ACRC0G_15990 [Fusobacteriaceae bacterium]
MAEFKRETFEKKNIITQDNLSLPGMVGKNQGVLAAGTVVAFNKVNSEWVKFVSATHGIGTFALGVTKAEAVTTATNGVKIAILKQGIVNAKEVEFDGEIQNLLMINGIIVL